MDNKRNKLGILGIFVIFIVIIAVFVISSYIGDLKMKSDLSIEERIAGEYCKNIESLIVNDWDNCFNEGVKNAEVKFGILQACKKQGAEEKKVWTEKDWQDCYTAKDWGL